MAQTNHLNWLFICIGSPCLLILILVCTCFLRSKRARTLGVLAERHYSFHLPGGVLPPPPALGPFVPYRTGSQDVLLDSTSDLKSSHLTVPIPKINVEYVQWNLFFKFVLEIHWCIFKVYCVLKVITIFVRETMLRKKLTYLHLNLCDWIETEEER